MTGRPLLRGFVAIAAIGVAVTVLSARPAAAHTTIKAANPTAGAVVGGVVDHLEIDFHVAVQDEVMTVTSPSSNIVEGTVEMTGPQTLSYSFDPLIEEGDYIIEWSVVTPDGHRDAAAYSFRYDLSAPSMDTTSSPVEEPGPRYWAVASAVVVLCGALLIATTASRRRRPAKR